LNQPSFIAVCSLAIATAFVLLAVLGLAMRAITALLPEPAAGIDVEVVAAITSSISALYPGARVARIAEIPCSSPPRTRRSV
jgi:hypothetical protein